MGLLAIASLRRAVLALADKQPADAAGVSPVLDGEAAERFENRRILVRWLRDVKAPL